MLPISLLFLTFLPLSFTLLIPESFLPRSHVHPRTADTLNAPAPESWLIDRLNIHTMSTHPDPRENWQVPMNTTISFDITLPYINMSADPIAISPSTLETLTCGAEFPDHTLPDGAQMCILDFNMKHGNADIFAFWMLPYAPDASVVDMEGFRPELSFELFVSRAIWQGGVLKYAHEGSRNITANNPKLPTSFLTCIEGPPYDGLRCKLHSYMSVDCDLTFEATTILPDDNEEMGEQTGMMRMVGMMGKVYPPVWDDKEQCCKRCKDFGPPHNSFPLCHCEKEKKEDCHK